MVFRSLKLVTCCQVLKICYTPQVKDIIVDKKLIHSEKLLVIKNMYIIG